RRCLQWVLLRYPFWALLMAGCSTLVSACFCFTFRRSSHTLLSQQSMASWPHCPSSPPCCNCGGMGSGLCGRRCGPRLICRLPERRINFREVSNFPEVDPHWRRKKSLKNSTFRNATLLFL